jgi:hypothetical protein
MIAIDSYMPNESANAMRVIIGLASFYFSYKTIIAYKMPGAGIVIMDGQYESTTTRKHIAHLRRAWADTDEAVILDVVQFQSRVAELTSQIEFAIRHSKLMWQVEEANEKED